MSEWQPIESAPQKALFECLIAFGPLSRMIEKAYFVPREPNDNREGPGWVTRYGDVTPTHWMPLPSPPQDPAP